MVSIFHPKDKIYARYCDRCLKKFKTYGKFSRICDKCLKPNGKKNINIIHTNDKDAITTK